MNRDFNLEEIDKTFIDYRKTKIAEGIVISIKENGVIFNLGGKIDALIPNEEVDNLKDIKIGDRFLVYITGRKNEDGLMIVSQKKAIDLEIEKQNARNIKLGCVFYCIVSKINKDGALISEMGDYTIMIPKNEICINDKIFYKKYINKKIECVATEINVDKKQIYASIRILEEKINQEKQEFFWRNNFINKIVDGVVKNIVPYGAFVEIDGVMCLCHISNISNKKILSPDEILKIGKKYKFKILNLDRKNKKVSIGYKQLNIS